MSKEIKIGSRVFSINYSSEVADEVLNKIIQWMEHPDHYSAHSGEGIIQNDNTLIDAPELIADIIDEILQPQNIDNE